MNITKELDKINEMFTDIANGFAVAQPLQSKIIREILNDPNVRYEFLSQMYDVQSGKKDKIVITYKDKKHIFGIDDK